MFFPFLAFPAALLALAGFLAKHGGLLWNDRLDTLYLAAALVVKRSSMFETCGTGEVESVRENQNMGPEGQGAFFGVEQLRGECVSGSKLCIT